jgi:hypothetical protein
MRNRETTYAASAVTPRATVYSSVSEIIQEEGTKRVKGRLPPSAISGSKEMLQVGSSLEWTVFDRLIR